MQAGFRADNSLGYQQITAAAAVGFTIPAGTTHAVVTAETQAVRWRDDGTDPTAAVGMPIAVNTPTTFSQAQLPRVKFIEQAASTKLNITYYG